MRSHLVNLWNSACWFGAFMWIFVGGALQMMPSFALQLRRTMRGLNDCALLLLAIAFLVILKKDQQLDSAFALSVASYVAISIVMTLADFDKLIEGGP